MTTPLQEAAQKRDLREVTRLLAEGAPVDEPNYRKVTALHVAAAFAADEIVALLLASGADPCARTVFEETPLHEAAGGGAGTVPERLAVLDRLLDAGCPIDAVDSSWRTALWVAAATSTTEYHPTHRAARLATLERLPARGAAPSITALNGKQVLAIDAARGLHQSKKYRHVFPEAVSLLESLPPR